MHNVMRYPECFKSLLTRFCTSGMANEICPSEVTNARFVFWPPGSFELGGRWKIFLNGNYDLLDRYWRALTPLCDAGILQRIKATTTIDGPEGMISCFTEDCNDVEGVWRAANVIREVTDYNYIMYYLKNNVEFDERERKRNAAYDDNRQSRCSHYLHTVRNCFYERDELMRWRAVPLQPYTSQQHVQNPVRHYAEGESMENEILPSEVTNTRFVFWPPGSFDLGGRWFIFLNGNYDLLDRYWRVLTPLCDAGILPRIRATTSIDGPEGMISCFTEDCNDVEGVWRAADAIREVTDYNYIMYYSKNIADSRSRGSQYLHTVRNCFYEKDELKRWRAVPR